MPSPSSLAVWLFATSAAVAQVPQFRPFVLPGVAFPLSNGFAAGDFDGDGDIDLTLISNLGPRVYRNAGSGALEDITALLPGPIAGNQRTAAFVDVDGDGAKELLLTWSGLARLLRWQNGAWLDISANLPAGLATISGAAAADLDLDGDQDLVCAGSFLDAGTNQLLINDGAGHFTATFPFSGQSFQTLAADVDGDGDRDVVFARPGVQLFRNDGTAGFTEVTATKLPGNLGQPSFVAIGDVNGDTTLDIFVGGGALTDRFLTNDGTGTFTIGNGLPGGLGSTSGSALADVDGDGDLDLWRGTLNYGLPTLLLNDGFGFFTNAPSRLPPTIAWASQCDAADLDGDGDPELLLAGLSVTASVLWNLHRHVASDVAPVPGVDWNIELASQPGYGTTSRFALLAIGLARLPNAIDLPPWGDLWIDFAAPTLFLPAWFQPFDGPQFLTISMPPIPQLTGLPLFLQGILEEPPGLPFAHFTRLVATTVQ